jgi:hypothetical protein
MAKMETYASKKVMKAHEKGEGKKMQMFEKKQGIKNVVKKSTIKKMGKKK